MTPSHSLRTPKCCSCELHIGNPTSAHRPSSFKPGSETPLCRCAVVNMNNFSPSTAAANFGKPLWNSTAINVGRKIVSVTHFAFQSASPPHQQREYFSGGSGGAPTGMCDSPILYSRNLNGMAPQQSSALNSPSPPAAQPSPFLFGSQQRASAAAVQPMAQRQPQPAAFGGGAQQPMMSNNSMMMRAGQGECELLKVRCSRFTHLQFGPTSSSSCTPRPVRPSINHNRNRRVCSRCASR